MSDSGINRRDLMRRGGVTIAGASLLGLAACGKKGETAGGGGGGGGGLVDRGSIRIEMPTHMIPPDPNTAVMQNGAEQVAKDLGVKVKFRGPDQYSVPAIQRIFDAAIAAKPTGIAATLPDPAALGPKIQEAVQHGIPVVLFNAGLAEFNKLGALTYVGQREFDAGREAGKRLAAAGIKNAIVINQAPGHEALEERFQGVKETLGAGTKQVAIESTSPTTIRNGIATALRQNPDIQAVLTLAPSPGEQALRAVKDAGKAGSVKVATFDITPPVLKAVANKEMLFAIDQQMYLQTYLSVVSLVTYIQYRVAPVTAVPTGPLFVDEKNANDIVKLAGEGIH